MRKSRWTQIYWDADESGMFAYVRVVPDFMDTGAAGFSHGLSISGNRFTTEDDANKAADEYDKFFDAMADDLLASNATSNLRSVAESL